MSDNTSIEWTEATWNPVRGCSIVSPGCTNCYAMRQAHRHAKAGGAYEGLTKLTKGGPVWTGAVRTVPELLEWPLRKRKPLRIFVNSMSDLFHEDVPDEFIDRVFSVMGQCEDGGWRPHTFQILTKRAARMHQYVTTRGYRAWNAGRMNHNKWPAPNVWLGVSVEDQRRADERIPLLLQTPAAVRWISAEPLLGPVDLTRIASARGRYINALTCDYIDATTGEVLAGPPTGIGPLDWVVVGGESGPGARAFRPEWARSIVKQCRSAGVPVFVKQMGSYVVDRNDAGFDGCEPESWPLRPDGCDPDVEHEIHGFREQHQGADCRIRLVHRKGGDPREWPEDLRVREYPHA